MRVGVHSSNLHLMLASAWPGAFAAFEARFVRYPDGRETARLLSEGAIDFGGTGSTPPITAEAAGLDVVYIAASAPRPANGGIFVRADSGIDGIADLKGRRVALVDGSFHNYLLARSLEQDGLRLPDVESVETEPAASLPALLEGRVDAWIAMAPKLEKALERTDLKLLARCGETIPNRSIFWTLAERGLSAAARLQVAHELARIGGEVAADPRRAAERLAASGAGDTGVEAWERVVRSRDFTIRPADGALLAEQQEEADTLHRHGYLTKPVRLAPLLHTA